MQDNSYQAISSKVPTIAVLMAAISESWDAETSVDEDWGPANPALGQDAATALVVQDYLGGQLVRSIVGDVDHYSNRLHDKTCLDLTRQQFCSGAGRSRQGL